MDSIMPYEGPVSIDCSVQSHVRYMLDFGIRRYMTIPYSDTMLVVGLRYEEYPFGRMNVNLLLPQGRKDEDGDSPLGFELSVSLYNSFEIGVWGTDKGAGLSISFPLVFVDGEWLGKKM